MNPEFAQFLSLYHVEITSVLFALLVITGIAAVVYAASASQWKQSYENLDTESQQKLALGQQSRDALRKYRDQILLKLAVKEDQVAKITIERDNALHNLGIVRAENDSLTERLNRVVAGNADLTRRRIDLEDHVEKVTLRHNALHEFVKTQCQAIETLAETGLFDHAEFFSEDEEIDSVAQWIEENENVCEGTCTVGPSPFLPLILALDEPSQNFRDFVDRQIFLTTRALSLPTQVRPA